MVYYFDNMGGLCNVPASFCSNVCPYGGLDPFAMLAAGIFAGLAIGMIFGVAIWRYYDLHPERIEEL
jgi:hypothetical protein